MGVDGAEGLKSRGDVGGESIDAVAGGTGGMGDAATSAAPPGAVSGRLAVAEDGFSGDDGAELLRAMGGQRDDRRVSAGAASREALASSYSVHNFGSPNRCGCGDVHSSCKIGGCLASRVWNGAFAGRMEDCSSRGEGGVEPSEAQEVMSTKSSGRRGGGRSIIWELTAAACQRRQYPTSPASEN